MSLECPRHDESGIRVPVPMQEPTPRNRTSVHPPTRPSYAFNILAGPRVWTGGSTGEGINSQSIRYACRTCATRCHRRVPQGLTDVDRIRYAALEPSRVSKVKPDKPQINPRAALLTRAKL